jgi:3-carboxy-cis,cis-muconate cycloisomerase
VTPPDARGPVGLFDEILARGGAREAVADAAWLAALLEVEAALAGATADAGGLGPGAAEAIAAACRPERFDVSAIAVDAAAAGNPVVPLVAALREAVRSDVGDGPAAAVHRGATSQDVVDTAGVLITRRALGVIADDLVVAADAAAALAREHRDRAAAGRTLLQQAAPITVGLRAAGWASGLDEAVAALRGLRPAVQLGGAVGTLAAFAGRGRAVRAALARRLDLEDSLLPWHTERGRVAELAGVLGRAGAAIGSVATDLVLLAQTEVGEVREGVPGRGGSSTLPHKRNPVAAISARAAAITVPGLVASLLTAASGHEYERAAGSWHAEWRPTSELLRTVGSGAAWLADALGHLVLDPARVAASLDVTGGLLLAENVTTSLRGRVEDPKGLVTAAASAGLDEGRPFADVLDEALADTDVTRAEIDAALDPATHVGEAVELVDAFLAARTARPSRSAEEHP